MTESNYDKALTAALGAAFQDLKPKNLEDVAYKSGATLEDRDHLAIPFLGSTVRISPADGEVTIDSVPADKRRAILVLHYLLRADGVPLTGEMVGFKDVPQGSLYFTPFRNRVLFSMLPVLARSPGMLEAAVTSLDGDFVKAGDLSFRFRVLPYVTAQYIYYRGEEGIPADLNILFDRSIENYLATEDIVVMCEEINRSLKAKLAAQPEHAAKDDKE